MTLLPACGLDASGLKGRVIIDYRAHMPVPKSLRGLQIEWHCYRRQRALCSLRNQ